MRSALIHAQVTFVTEDCCSCGVAFAITKELRDRRAEDHERFYCPNGHGQSYTGKTEAQKLTEQLEQVKVQRDHARAETERQKRLAAAAKGQVTKMRNRVARGVCPQDGCKRSFTDLQSHVETCHPHLLEAVES